MERSKTLGRYRTQQRHRGSTAQRCRTKKQKHWQGIARPATISQRGNQHKKYAKRRNQRQESSVRDRQGARAHRHRTESRKLYPLPRLRRNCPSCHSALSGWLFLLQLCAYRKQGHILEQSLADNRRTFVVTQRPKLIVRNVVVKQPKSVHGRDPYLFEPGHPVIGQFYVANVGGSRAHIIESLCWVRALQGINLPMERPYEGEYGNNPVPICDLNPGQPITAIIGAPPDATFIPTQAQSDGIRSSDIELGMLGATRWSRYILGWIDYRDDIGIDRRTAFCSRYEPATGRFVKVYDLDNVNED